MTAKVLLTKRYVNHKRVEHLGSLSVKVSVPVCIILVLACAALCWVVKSVALV